MFQTNATTTAFMSHLPTRYNTRYDPRPDLQADSAAWEQVLEALAEDIEPYSVLKSLRFAGAHIDNGQVVWRHLDLVMPHDEIHRDFLLPHKDSIKRAFAVLVA